MVKQFDFGQAIGGAKGSMSKENYLSVQSGTSTNKQRKEYSSSIFKKDKSRSYQINKTASDYSSQNMG